MAEEKEEREYREALRYAQDIVRSYVPRDVDLVNELLLERRREAIAELG